MWQNFPWIYKKQISFFLQEFFFCGLKTYDVVLSAMRKVNKGYEKNTGGRKTFKNHKKLEDFVEIETFFFSESFYFLQHFVNLSGLMVILVFSKTIIWDWLFFSWLENWWRWRLRSLC